MDVVKIDSASYTPDSFSAQGILSLVDKKILVHGPVPLFQFIDNAGLDGKSIHKIRVARELSFGCKAFIKDKSTGDVLLRPEYLSELVRYVDEDKLAQYRFILETDDKELLSEIIQQLLYLDIDIEVMLQNEEAAIRRMELFLKSFEDLLRVIEEAWSSIYHSRVDDSMREHKNTILFTLSSIGETIREMQVKDLKVAVMALKKSGKSAVVNCLLGDDYTPTSIELPTFTTCLYKKSKDGNISLYYKNNTTSFDSPASLKQYVLREFRNIHTGTELDNPDDAMNIRYVPRQNGNFPYTIIDTPGPDLAGSHHREIVYKWIQEADVILFIIDYSKYLTTSEEEFLRDIKRVFEEHRKFYSFIVVVNKLDLMYLSEEKKSGLRFIDFLRTKLKELGYKGIVIFGLSALQYLYALKAPQTEGCAGLDTVDGKDLREQLDRCLLLHQGKDDMTVLSFLDNQIRNLRWFHGKEDATLQDLKEKSGFEQLMRYINYISIEKAQIELLDHKMSIINNKLYDFRTIFIDNLLKNLEQDNIELAGMIHEITHFVETVIPSPGQCLTVEPLLANIAKDLSLAQKSLRKVLTMQLESCVRQLTKIFKSLTGEELLVFQRNGRIPATDGIIYSIDKSVIEKLYAPVLGKYKGNLTREVTEKNNTLEGYRHAMDEKIAMLNEYLNKDYRIDNKDLPLSKISDDFTGFCFPPVKIKLDDIFSRALIKDRLVKKRGLLGFILLVLSFGFFNLKTGDFTFDEIKLKKALFVVRKGLDDATCEQIEGMHNQLLSHITNYLSNLEQSMSESMLYFRSAYNDIFNIFIRDLNTLREERKSKIEFLKEAETGVNRFSDLWKEISEASQRL